MKRIQHGLNRCLICQTSLTHSKTHILAENNLCKKCLNKLPFIYKRFKVDNISCLALYEYNEMIRNLLLQFKVNADKDLAKVFFIPVKEFLKCQYKNYIMLPVPSSLKADKKRTFNHVEEMIKSIYFPYVTAFYKNSSYKQSSSNKYERIQIKQVIKLKNELLDHNKKYLIVDDLTTTHQTIRQCINLLRDYGVKDIKVLVVAIKKEKYI